MSKISRLFIILYLVLSLGLLAVGELRASATTGKTNTPFQADPGRAISNFGNNQKINKRLDDLEKQCEEYEKLFRIILKMFKQQEGFNIEIFENLDIINSILKENIKSQGEKSE